MTPGEQLEAEDVVVRRVRRSRRWRWPLLVVVVVGAVSVVVAAIVSPLL